jgi:hypothetical protein
MKNANTKMACERQDNHIVRLIAPTQLEVAIRDAVNNEKWHEVFAEKVGYVYAVNGEVRIPRTDFYAETDQDRVLVTGTDDYVYKDIIEGTLLGLFDRITKNDKQPVREVNMSGRSPVKMVPAFELDKMGHEIVNCCHLYKLEWAVAYSHHVFPPKLTLMLRAMRKYAAAIQRHGVPGKTMTQNRALVIALERLVRFVRRVSKAWPFINAMKAHERQADDNFDSARNLIYHYAERCSKLLILRIDLYFKPYYDVGRADKAINDYLRWLRSKACKRNVLPSYLGFIIKRENGLVRGMHWHVMVVCNGNEQQSAGYLTQQLGEMWAKRTGQGPGSYHNCYSDRERYPFNGLGLLALDDWEKMIGLRLALHYMTKQDSIIKATNHKVKNFWRSPIPQKARKKMGRPRSNVESLRLLRRMLGGKRSKYPPGSSSGSGFSCG